MAIKTVLPVSNNRNRNHQQDLKNLLVKRIGKCSDDNLLATAGFGASKNFIKGISSSPEFCKDLANIVISSDFDFDKKSYIFASWATYLGYNFSKLQTSGKKTSNFLTAEQVSTAIKNIINVSVEILDEFNYSDEDVSALSVQKILNISNIASLPTDRFTVLFRNYLARAINQNDIESVKFIDEVFIENKRAEFAKRVEANLIKNENLWLAIAPTSVVIKKNYNNVVIMYSSNICQLFNVFDNNFVLSNLDKFLDFNVKSCVNVSTDNNKISNFISILNRNGCKEVFDLVKKIHEHEDPLIAELSKILIPSILIVTSIHDSWYSTWPKIKEYTEEAVKLFFYMYCNNNNQFLENFNLTLLKFLSSDQTRAPSFKVIKNSINEDVTLLNGFMFKPLSRVNQPTPPVKLNGESYLKQLIVNMSEDSKAYSITSFAINDLVSKIILEGNNPKKDESNKALSGISLDFSDQPSLLLSNKMTNELFEKLVVSAKASGQYDTMPDDSYLSKIIKEFINLNDKCNKELPEFNMFDCLDKDIYNNISKYKLIKNISVNSDNKGNKDNKDKNTVKNKRVI